MRSTQDQQVIALFSGERIAPGCRGRRNSPQIAKKVSSRIAVAFAAALLGFATAATAITVRYSTTQPEPSEFANARAGANLSGAVSGSIGFEAALY
jgi:hypothetical protein